MKIEQIQKPEQFNQTDWNISINSVKMIQSGISASMACSEYANMEAINYITDKLKQ